MHLNRLLSLVLLLLTGWQLCAAQNGETISTDTLTADGPYIIYDAQGGADVISVSLAGEIQRQHYDRLPTDYKFNVVSYDGKHRFEVQLHGTERPAWQYAQPKKLFVMSDPHGDLDCVISLLQGNGVIDENYHWAYGKNHLAILGDIFDRGDDAIQIYWLVYKLEQEAAEAGGQLHFILGNHEPMVLMDDLRYTHRKYTKLAEELNMTYPELVGRNTALGQWICSRNTMFTVGRNLFVHAGLSKDFYDRNLSIPTVNEKMSHGLYLDRKGRQADSHLTYFLFATFGPVWYRGLVRDAEKYYPCNPDTLGMILDRYEADRVIVGHTIFDDISTFYDGRVIAVNVENAPNREAKRGRAILIQGKNIFVVGDEGILRKLQ